MWRGRRWSRFGVPIMTSVVIWRHREVIDGNVFRELLDDEPPGPPVAPWSLLSDVWIAADSRSMTDAEVTSDLAINVAAGLHTIRAAVSLFGDRGGTILVTGGGIATTPNPNAVSLGVSKVAMRHAVQALVKPLAERGIRIATATVRERISPDSAESAGVADLMWRLATDPEAPWELDYRAA